VIGERLNPTGRPDMQKALRDGDMDYLTDEVMEQIDEGAQLLDVNVYMPELDEGALMSEAITGIQGAVKAPLFIDSHDPAVMETGCRVYNGKPVINSVTGKKDMMERVFPIAKKYGALVIGLTLDESGVPPTAQGRLAIARKIADTGGLYGVPKEDIIIDCLALTAGVHQEQLKETFEAVRLVKSELGMKTVLGVSNVSYGLPGRDALNAAFLAGALEAGLDAAIMNPASERCGEVIDAWKVLSGEDAGAAGYIKKYRDK